MELWVSYRPSVHWLTVYNGIERTMTDEQMDEVVHFQDDDDDNWHLLYSFYRDEFFSMTGLGIQDGAKGWDAFLSLYLADEVVSQIADLVIEWDADFLNGDGRRTAKERAMLMYSAKLTL